MSSVRCTVDLVGAREIADMLGVSRQRVHEIAKRPDFPKPVRHTGSRVATIWLREDIENWIESSGRAVIDED